MGASLLAIAVGQPTLSLTDTPLSRAGSLPQGSVVYANPETAPKQLWEWACSRSRWISHMIC
ncbi:hypothetical protein C0J56_14080 [Pseudomonas fluorescens]|nr:hypothetical protein C0J56_14080 [Pseudomonas fluorescens]